MNASSQLPTFAELAQAKLDVGGARDKVINVKIAIPTARMMVDSENAERAFMALLRAQHENLTEGVADCEKRTATLQARVIELEEALRPFALDVPESIAKAGPRFPLWTGLRGDSSGYVNAADLQRANRLLCELDP